MQGYPISVGRYEILRPLAEGGFGQVYLARMAGAAGFHRIVAIKRIRREHTASPEFVRDFIKEARIGGYLQHHHVVQVLGFDEIEGNYLLVMEFVDGVGLEGVIHLASITEKPIPLPVVAEITAQAADGLQYIHTLHDPEGVALKLVHRDIKPSNLLLSRSGLVKITDFGIARAAIEVGKQTAAGLIKGTLNYLSPEQARGEELDHRSDLYCLGAILFEMLTLQRLWIDESPWVLLGKLGRNELGDRLDLLPPEAAPFRPVLERLLTENQNDRFESAAELTDAMQLLQRQLAAPGASLSRLAPYWTDEISIRRGSYDVESAPTRAAYGKETFLHKADPFELMANNGMRSDELRAPTLNYGNGQDSSPDSSPATRLVGEAIPSQTLARPTPSQQTLLNQRAAGSDAVEPTGAVANHAGRAVQEVAQLEDSAVNSKPSMLPWYALGGVVVVVMVVFAWLRIPREDVMTPTAVPVVSAAGSTVSSGTGALNPDDRGTGAGSGNTLVAGQNVPSTGNPEVIQPVAVAAVPSTNPAANVPVAATPKPVVTAPTPGAGTPRPAEKPAEKPTEKPTEKPAEKPAQKVAQLPAEKPAEKPAEPAKPPPVTEAPGKLQVTSRPASTVFVDGRPSGETPLRGIDLPAGTYRLRLSRPDMQFQQNTEVRIKPGQTSKVTCTVDGCDVIVP